MEASRERYLEKIDRLASHNFSLEQQLMATKIRLRSAEDTCLKYQILFKELQKEKEEAAHFASTDNSKINQILSQKVAERDRYWSEKVTQLEESIQKHYEAKISQLQQQIGQSKKDKANTDRSMHRQFSGRTQDVDLLNFKCKKLLKQKENLEDTIINLKIAHEKNQKEEVQKTRQILEIETREKQENQRKIYREKIDDLTSTIAQLSNKLTEAEVKADPNRESQISRLKKQLDEAEAHHNAEIQRITNSFSTKNKQLEIEVQYNRKKEKQMARQEKQMRKQLKEMEDKLFNQEKNHDEEILQLKSKMSNIRDQEIAILRAQLASHEDAIRSERTKWDNVMEDKDKQIERIHKKADEQTERHKEDRHKLKIKIAELKQKLSHYEDPQPGETMNLLQSLKQLEIKQADFANYENSVTFLGRELKKSMMKVEQKDIQINSLMKELADLKSENQADLNSLNSKLKKDRSHYMERITNLQKQVRHLNDKNRMQDRQAKDKRKQYEKQINLIKKQNKSFKQIIEEMEKDYNRVLNNRKAAQSQYREEREKGFVSKTDVTNVKRQKWLELQRQKNELYTVFQEKQQQIHMKHELEKEKLRNQRDEFSAESKKLKEMLDQLQKDHPLRVLTVNDKENLNVQYEKKVATLDLEIAFTKNLYESLRKAKSMVQNTEQQKQRNFQKISEQVSESEKDLILETSPRRQENMMFSFNPTTDLS